MGRVNWGISKGTVDAFDREKQYKPYDGPIPINGVYHWRVKKAQFISATRDKLPQLRIGLEIHPRASRKEKQYTGYYIMVFAPVADNTAFRYVPFLDAIGVTERDFRERTIADEEGNIKKIGTWRNDGETIIAGEIRDETDDKGQPRKAIGWMGEAVEEEEPEEEFDDDDEYDDEDDYDEDDDEGGF